MNNTSYATDYKELPFIVESDGLIIEVSKAFVQLTEYSIDDFLNKNIEDLFTTLRVSPEVNYEEVDSSADYFLFTKSLEVRFVNIEVIQERDKQLYIFKEKSNSRLEEKFQYIEHLYKANKSGIAIYSAPDPTLLRANETYIGFLNEPFNIKENSIGRKPEEFVKGYKGSVYEEIWTNLLNTNEVFYANEIPYDRYDRGITYWDSSIVPIYENGTIRYFVENVTEVTEHVQNRKFFEEKNKELKKQAEQLRLISENMKDALYIINKNGDYEYINEVGKKYAYQPENISKVGDSLVNTSFYNENGRKLTRDELPSSRLLRGEKIENVVLRVEKPNGTAYLNFNGGPIYNDAEELTSAILCFSDVTNKYINEQEIREKKELLEAIIENISDGLIVFDREGNCMLQNKAALTFQFLSSHKNISKSFSFSRCFDIEGNEVLSSDMPVNRILSGQRIQEQTLAMEHPEGKRYYVFNGSPLYNVYGSFGKGVLHVRDVTDSITKSEIIKLQKDQLDAILENMREALFIFDKHGKYILINKTGRQRFGRAIDKAGESYEFSEYYDLNGNKVPFEDTPNYHVLHGKTVIEKVMLMKSQTQEIYISVSGSPIFDDKGNFIYGVVTSHDVTEKIMYEAKLNQQQELLLKAERGQRQALEKNMEMKDEFLSLISHEFRTPLNVINAAIQAMNYICEDELPDKAKKYINIIRQNTFRQLRLVNNLLDITRVNAGRIKINKKNIDIVFLTNSIIKSVSTYALQKGVAVIFSSSITSKIVGIDDEKYERILLNLLSNAIKFTPAGKLIVVKLRTTKNKVCIEVKDNGIGIPEEKIDVIFDRFGQVDSSLSRQAEGAGIGLSLVKRFVDALDGSISVKSKIGKGSTFKIMFPNEQVIEELDTETATDLLDNRLVQVTTVEFSDIYL
ncbi:sensor histidine kinase [Clostridium beijerinckii]|uniref:sensor histidine kinase n=1 Tax=Clostridium beijerinckii TaxID=1520 RepID=UPI0006863552|nr:ATP-binding protein [Clostridium beijerinckii]